MQTSSDRWQWMETLFYKCLEMGPDAQSAFLEEHCGGDTELRREVEALLDEAGKPMDVLEQPVFAAAQGVVEESSATLQNPSTTIGLSFAKIAICHQIKRMKVHSMWVESM